MITPNAVLDFWFAGCNPQLPPPPDRVGLWFQSTPEQDAAVREGFGAAMEAARKGELDEWAESSTGRLALILLLDQLPRNAFRGTPAAFSGDQAALQHSLDAISEMQDLGLKTLHRVFLYLPLEHAEDIHMQQRCLALMSRAAAEAPPAMSEMMSTWVGFAEKHRDIIEKFGRFPHRNAVLGRTSTPAEQAFLAAGGDTFGQVAKG